MPTGIYKRNYLKIYTPERAAKISKALKGKKYPNRKPLSKEHKKKIAEALKGNKNSAGRKITNHHKRKLSESQKGDKSLNWKGDEVSYRQLHKWLRKEKGSPKICSHCGKKATDWANVDGEYCRKLGDYIPLCRSCHIKYDRNK